jgi:hypothetical protein
MMNLYNETMALEELTEEAIHTLGPDARDVLTQIRYSLCCQFAPDLLVNHVGGKFLMSCNDGDRIYIDTEIYSPENQSPPLGEGSPLALIRAKARNYR